MKLLKLYILNSGVFSNNVIDFTDNDNPQNLLCLSGVNGSGKTTLMDLILNLGCLINPKLSLSDIFFDRLKPNILTQTEFAQLDILLDNKLLSLVVGDEDKIQKSTKYQQAFIIETEIKSLIEKFENSVVKSPKDRNINIMEIRNELYFSSGFSERKILKINHEIFSDLFKKIEESMYKEFDPERIGKLPSIYFFNAHDREISDIRYSSIPKHETKYKIADRYSPEDDDLTKLLVYYDYAYTNKFDELKEWTQHVLEDKEIYEIYRPEFKVLIKTKNNNIHGLENLSSGEESLLIIAVLLYLKASENSIILIDEIDQSLHPEYQLRIMKIIKQIEMEKRCQIVVSSHSKFIWNAFEEKSIIRLNEVIR